jgi:small subunit ribosomal protein S16
VAVKIRLKRLGKTRSPHYRIVVADSRTKRDGRAIEEIGRYVPTEHPSIIEVNSERAQYWLSVGAQPSEQVAVLLKLTGDLQASKGEKATNTVKTKEAKAEFVLDTKKKPVLLPKEEKKAKVEEVAVVEEAPAAEATEDVVAEAVAEEAPAAEEAPVAEEAAAEAVAEEATEAPAEEA